MASLIQWDGKMAYTFKMPLSNRLKLLKLNAANVWLSVGVCCLSGASVY